MGDEKMSHDKKNGKQLPFRTIRSLAASSETLHVVIAFIAGIVVCLGVTAGILHEQRVRSNPLWYGWKLPYDAGAATLDEDVPDELEFGYENVTIRTIGGDTFTSEYEIEKTFAELGRTVTIHDYLGTGDDVVFTFSIQPVAHTQGLDLHNKEKVVSYEFIG